MGLQDLVGDLASSIHDAASYFKSPEDLPRLLRLAAQAMADKRPRTLLGSVLLSAGTAIYPLQAVDQAAMRRYKTHAWAQQRLQPWDPCYPGAVPRITVEGQAGAWQFVFETAPTVKQINAWGSDFRFWYFGEHTLGEDAASTSIAPGDRGLLLLRAQAEAMREIAIHFSGKPVKVQDGLSGMARNSTPSALYQVLLDEWKDAA